MQAAKVPPPKTKQYSHDLAIPDEMMFTRSIKAAILGILGLVNMGAHAEITLPRLISHGAILQRDQPVKIWGWADNGEEVTATINGKRYQTTTDGTGTWQIMLPAFAAGGPYSLYLKGQNELSIHNIYFGDVWLCSGQSNMELPVRRVLDLYREEVAHYTNDMIRYFHIPTDFRFGQPAADLKQGQWTLLNPSTALQMSAVAYFFARDLHHKTKVPVGMIINAVGGSPAEAWISEETIKKYPIHLKKYQQFTAEGAVDSIRAKEAEEQSRWHSALQQNDRGIREGWQFGPAPDGWKEASIPAQWVASWFPQLRVPPSAPIYGSVWFKRDFFLDEIPDDDTPIRLDLGAIIDADEAYVNGFPVGSTSYRYPPRIYTFRSSLLNKGTNTVTVRVRAYGENGEFIRDKPYALQIGPKHVDLSSQWRCQLGHYATTPLPSTTTFHYQPSVLYNALLHPLSNLKIKGVLWYQGESNTRDPQEYRALFADVIADWRALFGSPDLPFLYVQLANYMRDKPEPGESNWAELRQVQLESLRIPRTAMVTTIDIGEWNDIHPLNKKDVGTRLALAARRTVYGEDIVYSGPTYKNHRIEGHKVIVYFDHVGRGLATRDGGSLQHIAIAAEGGTYVWAQAELQDDHLIVWHDQISRPKTIRYAWGHNPSTANLINKDGLPASPFQLVVF